MKLFKWSFHYKALNNKDLLHLCPLYRLLSSLDQSNLSLLGFLLPWMWGISSRLLQQSTVTAPYLGWGHPSWPWTWSSSSRPSCTHGATAPRMWGSSFWPLLHHHSLALSVAALDIGHGVAPLSHASVWVHRSCCASAQTIQAPTNFYFSELI